MQWWTNYGYKDLAQVNATVLICVKAAMVLPTIAFVPLMQSQHDEKGKSCVKISLTLKTP